MEEKKRGCKDGRGGDKGGVCGDEKEIDMFKDML